MNADKLANVVWGYLLPSRYGHNACVFAFAYAPYMQVCEFGWVRALRDGFAYFLCHRGIHFCIQQHSCAFTQQPPRPDGNQRSAYEAHGWV